ncbi:MAG: alpha/beta hydrolase [Gammaproteobacteria bacterium]|nr:alpha/beta hydrolase [Gammaproteobacteria bacterium]
MKWDRKLAFFALLVFAVQATAAGYDYPFADPYVATVVGTPHAYRAELPQRVPVRQHELKVFPDREMPELLWYGDRLRYSVVAQEGEAPLVFSIAGTGASHTTAKMKLYQQAFYQAGFHVVSLPSPTHPNFITSASESSVPGTLAKDSEDLYHVMELIQKELDDRVQVSEYYLTGYSLGAAQAAFVTRLDDERRSFNFSKVLMLNPPVSLYNSVVILDGMLENNIPGGMDNFNEFYQKLIRKFTEVYVDEDRVEFNDEFLFQVYEHITERGQIPDDSNLAALIGMAFRISSSNMFFTSDVMTDFGFIKPKNLRLSSTSSLTDLSKVGVGVRFTDYLNEFLLPFLQKSNPAVDRQQVIDDASLKSIEGYLRSNDRIGLVHNADDVILATGELEYLRDLFGKRAKIYPVGGHLGNMEHRDNVAFMVDYFKGAH